MANYIFRHDFTRFGRRWRIDIITADAGYALPTTVVELPYNVVIDEPLAWECGYQHIPVGLPDAPKFTIAFDMLALEGASELQHLHDRLLNPYIKPAPATIATIEHPATTIYTGFGTIDVPAYTEEIFESPDDVPLLTNVVFLYSDRGNTGLLYFEGAFAQGLSTEPTNWDVEKGVLAVEFIDIWKFVLEQISSTTIVGKVKSDISLWTNQLYNHVWTHGGTKYWIESQIEDIDNDKRIGLYGAVAIFGKIQAQATLLVYRITRTIIGAMQDLDAAYLPFCKFFYQKPSSIDYPDVNTAIINQLELLTPFFIGAASESQDAFTEGGLATNGAIVDAETAFDFVFDQYEGGVIGRYTDSGIKSYRLAGRGTDLKRTWVLKATNIEVTKLSIGKNLIRASEVTADNTTPIRSKSAGQTKGQKDMSAKLCFHNHVYDQENIDEPRGGAGGYFYRGYKFIEGKLYYREGQFAGGEPIPYVAVTPNMELEVSKNTWFTFPFTATDFPSAIFHDGRGDEDSGENAYAAYASKVNASNGLARVIGAAMTLFYSEYSSVTLEFKTHLDNFPQNFATGGELLPSQTAFRYEIDWTGIVPPRMATKLPKFGALLKSSLDLKTGVITGIIIFADDPSGISISSTTDYR